MDFLTLTASGALAIFIQVLAWFWLKERLSRAIKHEYDADLEKLKHDLELELDKKKRLYEGKLSQYKKYYQFIDESSETARRELFGDVEKNLLAVIKDPSEENTLSYVHSMLETQRDVGDKFLKFKTEINGLRLEAGEELLSLLDRYTDVLEAVQNETTSFMKSLNENPGRFIHDNESVQKEINTFMQEMEAGSGARMKSLKDEIFWEMRKELGII
jgi:hypothetical protein